MVFYRSLIARQANYNDFVFSPTDAGDNRSQVNSVRNSAQWLQWPSSLYNGTVIVAMTARPQLRTQIASIARKSILDCSSASNWHLGRGSRIIVDRISPNNVALLVPKAVMGRAGKGSKGQAEGRLPPRSSLWSWRAATETFISN